MPSRRRRIGRFHRRHRGHGRRPHPYPPHYPYAYAYRGYYGGVPSWWAYPQVYGWVPRPVITQINRPRQVNVAGKIMWVQDMLGYGFPTMGQMPTVQGSPYPQLEYTLGGKAHSAAILSVGNTRRWLTFQAPEGGLRLGPSDTLTLKYYFGNNVIDTIYHGRNLRQSSHWV